MERGLEGARDRDQRGRTLGGIVEGSRVESILQRDAAVQVGQREVGIGLECPFVAVDRGIERPLAGPADPFRDQFRCLFGILAPKQRCEPFQAGCPPDVGSIHGKNTGPGLRPLTLSVTLTTRR